MMRPLDDREWLEAIRIDMLGRSLADYDHATSLLDTLDQCDHDPDYPELINAIEEYIKAVPARPGVIDVADRVGWVVGELEEMQSLFDAEKLEDVKPKVQALSDLRADLLVLLVEAGIARPNVMPDDPISLLRMFLPVD